MTAIDKLKFTKAINGMDEMVRKDISLYPLYLLGMAYLLYKFDEIERKGDLDTVEMNRND